MKLIIGLGNPGEEYLDTRHNVGFMVVDKLKSELKLTDFSYNKKFDANISKNKKVVLLKPQTFVNNSGLSVSSYINFYKIETEEILVIHDDVDFDLGKIKVGLNEGPAGHNGVKSIIKEIGTKDFWRLRVGVNSKFNKVTKDFVLKRFAKTEDVLLDEAIFYSVKEVIDIIRDGNIEKKKIEV